MIVQKFHADATWLEGATKYLQVYFEKFNGIYKDEKLSVCHANNFPVVLTHQVPNMDLPTPSLFTCASVCSLD